MLSIRLYMEGHKEFAAVLGRGNVDLPGLLLTSHGLDTRIPTHPLAALETLQAVAVIQAVVFGVEHLTLASDYWTILRLDLNWGEESHYSEA